MLHDGVGVRVASSREEMIVDAVFGFKLDALRTKCLRVDVSAIQQGRQVRRWHSQFSQRCLLNEFDAIRKFVVEVGDADACAAVP